MASDRKAFETAMVAAGYGKPERATRPDSGYLYQRDEDRFVGWSLASHTGEAEPVAVPLTALHLIEDAAQAHDQCRSVVHMALSLAEVYVARAAILAASPSAPIELIGQSSAATMEYLGDLLSNMDAVEEGDEWLDPIFEAAQARWPDATPPAATPAAPGEVKVRMWHDRIKDAHPGSTPEYWPSSLKAEYMEAEILELRATLSNPAPVAAPASVAQAIDQLVSTLAESKGWMRDYARALIEDAIDRRHLEVAAPAPASEAVAWEAASERYLADIIDRAPEPLRRLGEWLSLKLDEDDWKTAERYVLGAMESIATPSTGGGK